MERPTIRSGPTAARAAAGERVVLADVDAVGAARLDQIRPVVEDEERVRVAEGLGGGDDPVVVE